MQGPPGFIKDDLVCRLNKSLYGLKQSSRMWNESFHDFITKIGFVRSQYDDCMYIHHSGGSKMYLLIYVADLILVPESLNDINRAKFVEAFSGNYRGMSRWRHAFESEHFPPECNCTFWHEYCQCSDGMSLETVEARKC